MADYQTNAVHQNRIVTIRVLAAAFLDHAETYYVKNGRSTESFERFIRVLKPVLALYGSVSVDEFGPIALQAVRTEMINTGFARKTINQRIGLIRQVFKWGVAQEMVSPHTLTALASVAGLPKGRTKARETKPAMAVADEVVEKTLPFLVSPVAAMVRLQRLTVMRPGEVMQMRFCDIDRTHDVWEYTPAERKTDHHEQNEPIPLGPKAQSILTPWLIDKEATPEAFLFSPRDAAAERNAQKRKNRKTKVQPSQRDRSKANPKRAPRERYFRRNYNKNIEIAAQKAGVPHWFPNQLRHTALTAIRAVEGIEAAQTMACHKNVQVTEIYAEKNREKGRELARKHG